MENTTYFIILIPFVEGSIKQMFNGFLSLLLAGNLSIQGLAYGMQNNFNDKVLLSVAPIPEKNEEYASPASVSAGSVLVIDVDSHSKLYSKNASVKRPIASVTKLMTAYIVLEENDPNAVVSVSSNASGTPGSRMGLVENEQITVRDLLKGLLLNSGNDSAIALAEYNSGSTENFVKKMNEKAKAIGMLNTIYANPHGLDSPEAYSTAYDQSILASYLLNYDSIRLLTEIKETDVTSLSGINHKLTNTNALLGQMGIKGLKTGRTESAGECLVVLAETPDGYEVLSVVLGSQNRFNDTKILLDWVYRAFAW